MSELEIALELFQKTDATYKETERALKVFTNGTIDEPTVDFLVKQRVMGKMVLIMKGDNMVLRKYAFWILSNIITIERYKIALAKDAVLECIAKGLDINNEDVLMPVLWALSNFTGHQQTIRSIGDNDDILTKTVLILYSSMEQAKQSVFVILHNLYICSYHEKLIFNGIVSALIHSLNTDTMDIKLRACEMVFHMSSGQRKHKLLALDQGILDPITQIFSNESAGEDSILYLLKSLVNFSVEDESEEYLLHSETTLLNIVGLLNSMNTELVQLAASLLANLAHNQIVLQKIRNFGWLIPCLAQIQSSYVIPDIIRFLVNVSLDEYARQMLINSNAQALLIECSSKNYSQKPYIDIVLRNLDLPVNSKVKEYFKPKTFELKDASDKNKKRTVVINRLDDDYDKKMSERKVQKLKDEIDLLKTKVRDLEDKQIEVSLIAEDYETKIRVLESFLNQKDQELILLQVNYQKNEDFYKNRIEESEKNTIRIQEQLFSLSHHSSSEQKSLFEKEMELNKLRNENNAVLDAIKIKQDEQNDREKSLNQKEQELASINMRMQQSIEENQMRYTQRLKLIEERESICTKTEEVMKLRYLEIKRREQDISSKEDELSQKEQESTNRKLTRSESNSWVSSSPKPKQRSTTETGFLTRSLNSMNDQVYSFNPTVDGPLIAKREAISREVLGTEKTYVKTLKLLVEVFVQPLKQLVSQRRPILTSQEIDNLFSNIEDIFSVNMEFLRKIGGILDTWSWKSQIGNVFLELSTELITYEQFINNFENAMEHYATYSKRRNFVSFMEEQKRNNPEANVYLQFFLIQPVQRIPRYIMLCEDMLKNTPSGHPDRTNLELAVARITEVATLLNEAKRQAESKARLLSIQDNLFGFDTIIHGSLFKRIFIKEGTLIETDTGRYCYFFLFDDILLHTTQRKNSQGYKTQNVMALHCCKAFLVKQGSDNFLQILYTNIDRGESVELLLESPVDIHDWFNDLKSAIVESKKININKKMATQYLQ